MTQITLSTPRNYAELAGYQYFDIRILKDGEEIGEVTTIVPPEGENRDSTYIDWIGIDEAHRNNGFGTRALHLLVDLYGDIHLAPTDEINKRLYERLGEEAHWELGDVDQGYGVYSL